MSSGPATTPPETRAKVARVMLNLEMNKFLGFQYEDGSPGLTRIAPESYYLDNALMERLGNKEIQVDFFNDYKNNVARYGDFHQYFRNSQVPLLAVWGKKDEIFMSRGAEAYKKDLPNAVVKLIDAGHFAVETDAKYIAQEILAFLSKNHI
ncbi:uncharacterized protein N7459_007478 [Penicillium hispanicum]|uniref:uncharacterized protein n=1 Tax=Penicillium hispanicum TaxID=1080232 RepID=UPI0025420F2C|nr:uncharacterized protein N7459_007478 [Penicillium hispanicum]KAJ5578514.1 hypothetical protein N7459_007478 [Penicillium hispanicum]